MIKSAEPMTPERKAAVRAAIATLDKELMSKRKELEELRTNLTGRFSATVIEEEDEPKADKAIEIVSMPEDLQPARATRRSERTGATVRPITLRVEDASRLRSTVETTHVHIES